MLAGMAEGSRYLLYNGYSANLYQSGHLFTILALFFSTLAAWSYTFFSYKRRRRRGGERKGKNFEKTPIRKQ